MDQEEYKNYEAVFKMNLPTNEEIFKVSLGEMQDFTSGAIWIRDTYAKPLAVENREIKLWITGQAQLVEIMNKENKKIKEQLRILTEAIENRYASPSCDACYENEILVKEALDKIKSLDEEGK